MTGAGARAVRRGRHAEPCGSRPLHRILAAIMLLLGLASPALSDTCEDRPATKGSRVALVIGNGAYAKQPLANATSDARAVAAKLGELGFRVIACENLGLTGMRDALRRLGTAARGSEIVALYFAGHGAERRGKNFLIPVDAKLEQASDLALEAMAMDVVLEQLGGATRLRLVLLDACRNNPFPLAGEERSATRGLGRPPEEDNTLIAYAAKDGTVAADGSAGGHSPFTTALLKHIGTPGLEIRFVLAEVRDDVVAATDRRQLPHIYGTLGRDRIFLASADATTTAAPAVAAPPAATAPAPAPPAAPQRQGLMARIRGVWGEHKDACQDFRDQVNPTWASGKYYRVSEGFFDGCRIAASRERDGAAELDIVCTVEGNDYKGSVVVRPLDSQSISVQRRGEAEELFKSPARMMRCE